MSKGKDTTKAWALLKRRVAKAPTDPGVYRWKDAKGQVLYIGKAKNLRSRMQTYVQDGAKHSPWTTIMVRQIADFDVTVVRSELEALILESNLIKEFQPKYNIMLKDDKGYSYVRMTLRDLYPSIEVVRRMSDDDATYFGPFLGSYDLRSTLDLLDGILHFRACNASLEALNKGKKKFSPADTPCLDKQIGKCCGLCIGAVTQEEYAERTSDVARFFKGHYASIKKRAQEEMKTAATEKKFEKAARLRDSIGFIEKLELKQVMSDTSGDDADVFGIAIRQTKSHVVLLRVRDGKVIEEVSFPLKGEAQDPALALEQFLPQYYSETQDIPRSLILGFELQSAAILELWLSEKRRAPVNILLPERGKKSKLLLIAERNAEEKVSQQLAAWEAEVQKVEGALRELQDLLKLPVPPRRIEGYDISHLGGSATVGSMVVFLNGKPKREHYRSFNMKTVKEGDIDDYKSLAEALRRRLKYITEETNAAITRFKSLGIEIGKAKKAEQERIEEISKAHPSDIGSDDIRYADYIVARRKKEIIGFCRLYEYQGGVMCFRSLWVKEEERGKRLGQLLVRLQLAKQKKGKVYVHILKEGLLEYYSELGFQLVDTPPPILQKKLDDWAKAHHGIAGSILVCILSKQKMDPSFHEKPDLLLIDGGKGQLSAAKAVLDGLRLDIPVAGLAKREEEIFIPARSEALTVPKDSQARFLLQRLRDEAHRFANAKREKRLESRLTQSALDDIPGIGETLKQKLLLRFGSFDAVLKASDSELREILSQKQVEGIQGRIGSGKTG